MRDFLLPRIGEGLERFPGEFIAPLTPEQERAREFLGDFQPGQFDTLSQTAIERALSGDPSFQLDPQTTERFFREAVEKPIFKTFEREIEPRIRSGFSGLGSTFGTRRGLAVQRALGDIGDTLASQLSTAQFQNQRLQAGLAESAAERQIRGVGLAQQFEAQPIQRASQLFGAAEPFRQVEQQRLSAEFAEFLRTRPELSPTIPQALQFVSSPGQTAGGGGGGGGSQFGGALGTLGGILLGNVFGL